jgi:hypothetical protein
MEVLVSLSSGIVSESSAARWRLSKKIPNTIILTVANGKRTMGKIVLMQRKILTFQRLIDHARSRKNGESVKKAKSKIREYKALVHGLKKLVGFTGFQVLAQDKVARKSKAKSMGKSTYTVKFDAPAKKKMTSQSNVPMYLEDFTDYTPVYRLDLHIDSAKMWKGVTDFIDKHAGENLLHTFDENRHYFKPFDTVVWADDKTDLITLALKFGGDDEYADDAIEKVPAAKLFSTIEKYRDDDEDANVY